jgi:DNA replication and repair protein RecF
LAASYPKDRARGMTCVGPHRADLLASLSGADIRQYASQGQQRAVVLALKLAEVQLLAQALDGPPILLLDDVSSELDATRSRLLFAAVARLGCQVWVSTTGAVDLPISGPASRFEIVAGTCRRIG